MFRIRRNLSPAIPLILLLTAVAAGTLSMIVVPLGDDLDYAYRMQGAIWQSWGHIRDAGDFFSSQAVHYMHVNGRAVAHALVQLFNAVLGQEWFALCNAMVYPVAALMLARLGGARPLSVRALLTALFMLFAGFLTKMLPTCQIGYVWGLAVNLLWTGLFLSGRSLKVWQTLLCCLLGLVAGNWQEAFSIGIGGAAGVLLISQWLHHPLRRLSPSRQWMAVCYIAGTVTVCLAPSTVARAASVVSSGSGLAMMSPSGLVYALLSLRLTYIFFGVVIWRISRRTLRVASFLHSNAFWVCAMLLLAIFNCAVGVFGNRQLFGIEMCAAVMTLRLLPSHAFTRFWTAVAVTAVAALYVWQAALAMRVRNDYDEIERLYLESTDGRVYFDRLRPTCEGFTREARIYEELTGLYDNDPHHSLMKHFRHIHRGRRPLLILPAATQTLEWRDTVICFAPGHYLAIGHQGDTVRIPSSRTFLGLTLPPDTLRPYDFHKSIRGAKGYRLIVIPPSDPWRIPAP